MGPVGGTTPGYKIERENINLINQFLVLYPSHYINDNSQSQLLRIEQFV